MDRNELKIIVIDDSKADLDLLSRSLCRAGFVHPLIQLHDGQSAIAYFGNLEAEPGPRPHIALLDIEMPMRNGLEVLAWLRSRPSFETFPVLMHSSAQSAANISRSKELKALDFLPKEARHQPVIRALDNFLEATSSRG